MAPIHCNASRRVFFHGSKLTFQIGSCQPYHSHCSTAPRYLPSNHTVCPSRTSARCFRSAPAHFPSMLSRSTRAATRYLSTAATPNPTGASANNARRYGAMLLTGGAGLAAALAVMHHNRRPVHAAAAVELLMPRPAYDERGPAFKPPLTKQYPGVYQELVAKIGEEQVTLDDDELEQRGKEQSGYATPANPQCVVFPRSTQEVSEVLKIAHKNGVPVIPLAAGTSLEGHTVAPRGGICLDTSNMNHILSVNVEDMDCVVQPGVGWVELNQHCAQYGMFLGVDPAPGACIGGMCGTCCSGTNAVRYGTMKDQVLNLTVVMADGTIVKTGQRARKSSAGYDLARIFVGSEGTLGIVTEATLRLRNVPECARMARVSFPSVHAACSAVIEILQRGVQMGAIELFDEEMIRCVNHDKGMDLPLKPTIFFRFTGSPGHVAEDVEIVRGITDKYTKDGYHFAGSEEESYRLWDARKGAFWSAQYYLEGKEIMATDVAVPISRLADCIMETKKELDASFLFAPIVGHVGDGNFHSVICFDPKDQEENDEAHRLNVSMVKRAIAMDGTCTGEHGIGLGKKEYLVPELGENAVELMRKLKLALDPKNILNPGKIIDVDLPAKHHHHHH